MNSVVIKPTVKIWCLLHDHPEPWLVNLQETIVKQVVELANAGIHNENDMTVLFPPDLMKKGLGQEIVVEIDSVHEDQIQMTEVILKVVKSFNRNAFVQVTFTYTGERGILYRHYASG